MRKRVVTLNRVYLFSLACACLAVLAGPALAGVLTVTNVIISYGNSTIDPVPAAQVWFNGTGTSAPVQYSGQIIATDGLLALDNFDFYCQSTTTACTSLPTIYFDAHGSGYAPAMQFSLALQGRATGPAEGNFWAWVIHGDPSDAGNQTQLGSIDFLTTEAGPLNYGPTAPVPVDLSTSPTGEFDLRVWFRISSLGPGAAVRWGSTSADLFIDQQPSTGAVPEPATVALVGVSIAGLIWWRLKRRA